MPRKLATVLNEMIASWDGCASSSLSYGAAYTLPPTCDPGTEPICRILLRLQFADNEVALSR
jgi:hypothetical protein